MVQQMTTAAAAPTAPVVSALEPRSPAHPSHLPMYPHHSPSRVTAQVVGDGFWCYHSSPACHERPPCVPGRTGRSSDAVSMRMPAPWAAVGLAQCWTLMRTAATVGPFLGLWLTVQAAEGVLHNLSTPCQPRPLIYEREGYFVNAGERAGRVY
mgnify:CR=1 FL=1